MDNESQILRAIQVVNVVPTFMLAGHRRAPDRIHDDLVADFQSFFHPGAHAIAGLHTDFFECGMFLLDHKNAGA